MRFILDKSLLQIGILFRLKYTGIAIDRAANQNVTVERVLEANRRKACDYLNSWHLYQLIVQTYATILTIIITSNLDAWYHWILLDFHVCVFWTHFIQVFVWNRYEGRPWDRTFELSHMLNIHYNIHLCIYVAYSFCLTVCFINSCYLWVFNSL